MARSSALAFGALLTLAAWPALATTTSYQAESATIFHGVLETTHSGYTGSAYVNCSNEVGSYVQWTISVPQATNTATLTWRFANGTTADRPMEIQVNGVVVMASLSFPGTGAWTTWQTRSITVSLPAGSSTVRSTGITVNGPPNLDRLDVDDGASATPTPTPTATPPSTGTDWGREMVESTMARKPSGVGTWEYSRALYLWGQYLVWKRTQDPRHLKYVRDWVDTHVNSSGDLVNVSLPRLDNILPANLFVAMYNETGLSKYRIAAQHVRDRLKTYPRTSDGGFLHQTSSTMKGELWADGTFMVLPFLVHYGQSIAEAAYASDEAGKQVAVYGSHLKNTGSGLGSGLVYHAYDEDSSTSWSTPPANHSAEHWCRAVGWYGMALIEVLETMPETHPRRAATLANLQTLVAGLVRTQSSSTGRWFQVMDKGDHSDNWTETSCSCMHTYVISRAVQRGYVDASLGDAARRGYQGVLDQISLGSDGRTNLRNICVGTDVGSYSYYIGRTRATNDMHGLGAFLIMYEQLR
jgi:unsaturated rhamnogalacturonyl hydrolase